MNAIELLAQLGAIKSGWTPYTPIVTTISGAITSYTAAGRYLLVGKTLHLQVQITITNNGTGAQFVVASLPAGLTGVGAQVIAGREVQVTGTALIGTIWSVAAGAANIMISTYNNSYPGGANYVLVLAGVIEVN